METANIPMTQENSHVGITNENNDNHFLQYQGPVHSEFILQCQTVNQAYYVKILKQLHEGVWRKRPELWSNDWVLYHGNDPTDRHSISSSFWLKINY
jgi:hypothetical protein